MTIGTIGDKVLTLEMNFYGELVWVSMIQRDYDKP